MEVDFQAVVSAAIGQVDAAESRAAYSRLITRVTGTPTLEKKLRRTRPGYDEYLSRTSSFWPRPPREA